MTRYDPIGWIDGLTNNLKKQKEQLEKELEKVEEYNRKNNAKTDHPYTLYEMMAKVKSLEEELKLETAKFECVKTLYLESVKRATAAEKEVESLQKELKIETAKLETVKALYLESIKTNPLEEKIGNVMDAWNIQMRNISNYQQHIKDQETLISSPDSDYTKEHEKNIKLRETMLYIKGYAQGIGNKHISEVVDIILERNK